jgi:DNA-binding NarL/FixJ family response regulator
MMNDEVSSIASNMLETRASQASLETRVLIVARSSAVRAGLRALLEPEFEIVGETSSVDTLEVLSLDVIVTDNLSSLNASIELPAIVLISDHTDAASDLLEFNPHGWALVSPDAPEAELKAAIQAAAQGFTVLPPNILEQLLERNSEPHYNLDDAPLEALTLRELEVLEALSQGLANKHIAKQLEISQSTVKFHIAQIYAKLNVSSRVSAVNLAIRHGLIAI